MSKIWSFSPLFHQIFSKIIIFTPNRLNLIFNVFFHYFIKTSSNQIHQTMYIQKTGSMNPFLPSKETKKCKFSGKRQVLNKPKKWSFSTLVLLSVVVHEPTTGYKGSRRYEEQVSPFEVKLNKSGVGQMGVQNEH